MNKQQQAAWDARLAEAEFEAWHGTVPTLVEAAKTGYKETPAATAAITALEQAAKEDFEAWFEDGDVTFSLADVDVADGCFELSGTVHGTTVTLDVVAHSELIEYGWLDAEFAYYLGAAQVYTAVDLP